MVVERIGAAELAQQCEAALRPSGADHAQPERQADLHGGDADASAGAVHQHRLRRACARALRTITRFGLFYAKLMYKRAASFRAIRCTRGSGQR
jgi:hypothetical protein